MGDVTPLFVFGMGRSGTTNALRVLNADPCVMLTGEISLSVLKQFLALLEAVERSYEKREAVRDGWYARKAEYMFESFGYLAKGGRGRTHRRATAKFMGHKTPRLETLFDQYEAHFASAGMTPRYVYCARNAIDCWRSYKAMEWNQYDHVGAFLKHYAASYETLERIRDAVGDRVLVLDLDALKAAPDPIAFYGEKLFGPLGLDMQERTVRRIRKISKSSPPSKAPELDDADRAAIEAYAKTFLKNSTQRR